MSVMPSLSRPWLSLLQNNCAHPCLDCVLKLLNGSCWSSFQQENTVNVRLNSGPQLHTGTSTEIANNGPCYSLIYCNLPYWDLALVVFIFLFLLLQQQPSNDVRAS
jgi:hypothetical protein